MPSTTKVLLAGLMAATATQAATTTGTSGQLSGKLTGVGTFNVKAAFVSQDDNNAGGASTLTVTNDVMAYGFSVKVEPKFTITTKSCALVKDSPTVSLTMQLGLPAAMKTAITVANTALTLSGGTGVVVADIEKAYTFDMPFAKLASFKLSDVAPANVKLGLMLTGSDVDVKVNIADIAVYKAGNAIPLTATMTIGDASKITLPTSGLCAKGKPSVICAGEGVACGAMCAAVKAFAPAKWEQTIDFATVGLAAANALTDAAAKKTALTYFAKCGPKGALTKDCFSIGDTTKGACVKPPPPTTTTAAAAAKSGASTTVMSAVVAGASLMMALMM